jgi:anti-anti-sigma factor
MIPSSEFEPLPTVEAEQPAPRTLLLRVRGELDQATTVNLDTVLDNELGEPGVSRILVDLSRVTLLGTAALRTLQQLRRRCRLQNTHLVLVGTGHPAVHRPLRITGLLPLFDTRPTVQAALHQTALHGHPSPISRPDGTGSRAAQPHLSSTTDAR